MDDYNVSDADFLNMSFPEVTEDAEESVQTDSEVSDDTEKVTEEDVTDIDSDESDEEPEDDVVESEESDEASTEEEADSTSTIDYEGEYQKILKPFKANGKEFQVKSADEAIQLMQMGVGFNKKMSTIKPYMKVIRTLEQHNLLDESKLNFLIDLDKKNPEAIKKLMKDSEINPLEVDLDEVNYRASNHTVSDAAVNLADVIDDIKESSTATQALTLVTTGWDSTSRSKIIEQPEILRVINEHMQLGIYDQINSVVERERLLGRLNGKSDLEAYHIVGDQLHATGAFNAPNANATPAVKAQVTKPAPDPKVLAKKKAASIPSNKGTSQKGKAINFNLSDEDFLKLKPNFL